MVNFINYITEALVSSFWC